MAKYLRYAGEFLSRQSVTWRVEILQEADAAYSEVGELDFDADEALVIEYEDTSKEEPICGSTATINVISPGDRTYVDLYTIEVGSIRMDVYREGVLYWSGLLDPEFYEEPYEKAFGYTVTFTFSDFGILDRLKYNLTGMQTLSAILTDALERTGINYTALDYTTYCSTYFDDGTTKATLDALSIPSDNFFDEDGEASTLEETVEGILWPLSLRIIQRAGTIYVYDLNGLYNNATSREIEWDGSSSTLSVDKVANNVVITFSPYSSSDLLDDEVEYTGGYSTDVVNLTSNDPESAAYGNYHSFYPDYSSDHMQGYSQDYNLVSFTIFQGGTATGLASISTYAKYFHILPMVNGPSECSGVAWLYRTGHSTISDGATYAKINTAVTKGYDLTLMTSNRVFIPALSDDDQSRYYIRLTQEMLLDPRYNPFGEMDEDGNEGGNYRRFAKWTAWAFIPVAITLYDSDGTALYHYDNSSVAKAAAQGYLPFTLGSWVSGAASFGDAWVEYYDPDDLEDGTGILGWQTNRQCIGRPDHSSRITSFYIYDSFKQMDDGEYIPYPPCGGYLEVKVYAGVNCYNYGDAADWDDTQVWELQELYDKVRWLLYKAPQIDVVKNNLVFDESELDDVEYSAYINEAAEEEISIDTICGTSDTVCPTAKGILCKADDGLQIQQLYRAGVTDHPENLLIGTLYSQFAARHTTLQGECVIDSGGLCTYTEQNQGDKLFMIKGETQDVIEDTTDATYVELSPDEYEAE